MAGTEGIAVDSSGNIYVTNDGSVNGGADNIAVFRPAATATPPRPRPLAAARPGSTCPSAWRSIRAGTFTSPTRAA